MHTLPLFSPFSLWMVGAGSGSTGSDLIVFFLLIPKSAYTPSSLGKLTSIHPTSLVRLWFMLTHYLNRD